MYGLMEDQVTPGARICNPCRCKYVRITYVTCPLPSCPLNKTHSKSRLKRLRQLPRNWLELPAEVRDPLIKEFQIPNSSVKICSACFAKICRRLQQANEERSEESTDSKKQWTDEELEQLRRALREHGTNWRVISGIVPGKDEHQCKSYYLSQRKKLGLGQDVAEYYRCAGLDRRPCLTDEEESGSSTSSCDEMAVSCALAATSFCRVTLTLV